MSSQNTHWAEQYIWADWRWSENGNGPDRWNCWNFVREIQRVHFARDIPLIPIGDPAGIRAALAGCSARSAWRKRLSGYCEGDIVLMRGMDLHVGVWIEADAGGVLHCQRDLDVNFDDLRSLALHGYRIERVWGWRGN